MSFLYAVTILPRKESNTPRIKPTIYPVLYNGMIIIPFNPIAIHLHHWVICFFICLASIFIKIPTILVGFSFGLFLQGIAYNDSLRLLCDNPYN